MVKKSEKNKGITLIALVVTIIVLIILASISIGTLTGKNGIIGQSKDAKEQTEIAEEKEVVSLATVKAMEKDRFGNVTRENLQEALDELTGEGETKVTGDTIFTILFIESEREYEVNSAGEFVEPIDYANIYTYTEDGYITGLKQEYMRLGTSNFNKKYATTNDIMISSTYGESYLIDELNGTLRIPNKIKNTTIIGIDSLAFLKIVNLKQVIIENGIKEIGKEAFCECAVLESVTLPETLKNIDNGAFAFCNKLKNITIPYNVQYIDYEAFYGCDNLTSIIVEQEEGSLSGEPWGAEYATITYVGNEKILQFANGYLSNKSEAELEELILKDEMYIGTFDEWLKEQGKTRDDLRQEASNNNMTYEEYLKSTIIQNNSWIVIEYKASILGILDKSVEELENIFVEKAKESGAEEGFGEINSFDEYLEKLGVTREEFEKVCKENGIRSEEDYLKYMIVMVVYEL